MRGAARVTDKCLNPLMPVREIRRQGLGIVRMLRLHVHYRESGVSLSNMGVFREVRVDGKCLDLSMPLWRTTVLVLTGMVVAL